MNPLENLRPPESLESVTDFWRANDSRWFIHRELQHLRDESGLEPEPFDALYSVYLDPRAEDLDRAEFEHALVQQFMRFQERKPKKLDAVLSILSGTYKDHIWGLPLETIKLALLLDECQFNIYT